MEHAESVAKQAIEFMNAEDDLTLSRDEDSGLLTISTREFDRQMTVSSSGFSLTVTLLGEDDAERRVNIDCEAGMPEVTMLATVIGGFLFIIEQGF